MPKIKIVEGQEIFVTNLGGGYSKTEPNLNKWIVVKANGTSFYAKPIGTNFTPNRFGQRDFTHSTGWGVDYRAYLAEREYWEMIERNKERKTLREALKIKIDEMSLNELRELSEKIS